MEWAMVEDSSTHHPRAPYGRGMQPLQKSSSDNLMHTAPITAEKMVAAKLDAKGYMVFDASSDAKECAGRGTCETSEGTLATGATWSTAPFSSPEMRRSKAHRALSAAALLLLCAVRPCGAASTPVDTAPPQSKPGQNATTASTTAARSWPKYETSRSRARA